MEIRDLSAKELENIERNYRNTDATVGGKYSLAEVMMEKLRRSGSGFSGKTVFAKILAQTQVSRDGLTTYSDLWDDLYPDLEFTAHASIKKIGQDLGAALHYCVEHNLPVITVLVVQKGNRELSEEAINGIFNGCRELGVKTGPTPAEFIAREKEAALKLDTSGLP